MKLEDVQRMPPEERRLACAKACGVGDRWVLMKRGLYYRPDAKGYTYEIQHAWVVSYDEAKKHEYLRDDQPVTIHSAPLPDYENDLNAMHEAETTLDEKQRDEYSRHLVRAQAATNVFDCNLWLATHATAQQRLTAFLMTVLP